jgi:hypothetical protein
MSSHGHAAASVPNGADSSSDRKPELLVCAAIDADVYSYLSQHFRVHTLCMPLSKHAFVAKTEPALPVTEGEGEVERRWEEFTSATTPQLLDYLSRQQVDALMSVGGSAVTREVLEAAGPRLHHVSTVSVGYNHIDVETATSRGVLVSNTPGVLDNTTADLAVGLMLVTARRLTEAAQTVKESDCADTGRAPLDSRLRCCLPLMSCLCCLVFPAARGRCGATSG